VGDPAAPRIYVLAGTNGAGKSSIGGAMVRLAGSEYFNPDEAAGRLRAANPGMAVAEANSAAWHEGRRLLERAIAERLSFNFETTLGGRTIVGLLEKAIEGGIEVRVWYVGLASPELHIQRVQARVRAGGHDIPEADIRRRFDDSRHNLVRLLPGLTELRVFDNTDDGDPAQGREPRPRLLMHFDRGRIIDQVGLAEVPHWAKPIIMAALDASGSPTSV